MGHPGTATDFLLEPVGGPHTSLGWSWGQGTPLYPLTKFLMGPVVSPNTSLS